MGLFDTDGFIPRAICGNWSVWMICTYVISDIILGVAYLVIPIPLFLFWKKKRYGVPYPSIYLLFAAFIFLCGLSHLCDALMFFWPVYQFTLLVLVLAALVSITTSVIFPFVAYWISSLKTPLEYYEILDRLKENIFREKDVCKRLDSLIFELEAREAFYQAGIEAGTEKQGLMHLEEIQKLKKVTMETRRMLGLECDKELV